METASRTDKCIVNYITMNGWRPHGQERMANSLRKHGYDGDVLLFDEKSFYCPKHSDIPYAFKVYVMETARKKGYRFIIWVDASFWAIRPLDDLFVWLVGEGVLFQNSGYPVGQWSSDDSLSLLGLNREEAFEIPMFSGGFIGLDLEHAKARYFLDAFYHHAEDGRAFKGAWKNKNKKVSEDPRVKGHRHDMVVGSILAHRMNIKIQPNNSIFAYYNWYKENQTKLALDEKIFFAIEGGRRKID